MKKFKVGEIVKPKSGGCEMTILRIDGINVCVGYFETFLWIFKRLKIVTFAAKNLVNSGENRL